MSFAVAAAAAASTAAAAATTAAAAIAATAATTTILCLGGGWTVPYWQQVIMARDVTVLWKVIWILGDMTIIAEYSLNNAHCRFCNNQQQQQKNLKMMLFISNIKYNRSTL